MGSELQKGQQTFLVSTPNMKPIPTFVLPTPLPSTPSCPSSENTHDILDGYQAVHAFGTRSRSTSGGEHSLIAQPNFDAASVESSVVIGKPVLPISSSTTQLLAIYFRKVRDVKHAWNDASMVKTQFTQDNKEYSTVIPLLYCTQCASNVRSIFMYDNKYTGWCVNDNMWYEHDYITTFAFLLEHEAHSAASAHIMPQFFVPGFPTRSDDKKLWDAGVRNIIVTNVTSEVVVCIVGDGSHYAVMEVALTNNTMTVHDGYASSTDVKKYHKYAKFVLQSIGLLPVTAGGE